MPSIAIIDYGMGNLHSAAKAISLVATQHQVLVTHTAQDILSAERVVFPGVGGIGHCMQALKDLDLLPVLDRVLKTKPLLAICVGMQALLTHSEENNGIDGINFFQGQVKRIIPSNPKEKVPHMGWNQVLQRQAHPIWQNIPEASRFYFVHSYCSQNNPTPRILGETLYCQAFSSVLTQDNVVAVQFHPEKSQKHGLQLLRNFVNWQPIYPKH